VQAGLFEPMLDLFAGHFARMIERRIAVVAPEAQRSALSGAVVSRVFAGGLIELLRWWIRQTSRPTPQEMDARFHEIVWSGLSRTAR
jgi:hypothetical protein